MRLGVLILPAIVEDVPDLLDHRSRRIDTEELAVLAREGRLELELGMVDPGSTLAEQHIHALVLEGTARPVKPSEAVIAAFRAKYDWNIDTDPEYSLLLELTPTRKVMGKTIADC